MLTTRRMQDKSVAIIVLPTPERLKEIRQFAEDKSIGTLIITNQQVGVFALPSLRCALLTHPLAATTGSAMNERGCVL